MCILQLLTVKNSTPEIKNTPEINKQQFLVISALPYSEMLSLAQSGYLYTNVTVNQWPKPVSNSLPKMVHQQFTLISYVVFMIDHAHDSKPANNFIRRSFVRTGPVLTRQEASLV